LDRAWKDVADLRKESAEASSKAQSSALEKEIQTNAQLRQEIDQARQTMETSSLAFNKEVRT
jgi:hypothetical protein